MTDPSPLPPDERPFVAADQPFAGFEVAVFVDRPVYAPGDTVRITVSATNGAARAVEHAYPGWQRFVTTVRDRYHRVVASDEVTAAPRGGFRDRWLPGQLVLYPLYWPQHEGPLVPGWSDELPGPRVDVGTYRVRVTWLGQEPGGASQLGDVWSSWFEVV